MMPQSVAWGANIAAIIGSLLPFFWLALVAALLFPAREAIASMLARLGGLEIFGVKVSMVGGGRAMNAAISMATKHRSFPVEVPESDRRKALERAEREQHLLSDAQILWVDDRPSNNRNESRMLRTFGVIVTFAASTGEALDALQDAKELGQPFHLILSDISRNYAQDPDLPSPPRLPAGPPDAGIMPAEPVGDGGGSAPALAAGSKPPPTHPRAGVDMVPKLREAGFDLPVIFYVGNVDPKSAVPPGAFGITNRPDLLLQLVLDALARTR